MAKKTKAQLKAEFVTGALVTQAMFEDLIDSLGSAGYTYMGVANTSDTPVISEGPVAYLAKTDGTYTNFGGITVAKGEVAVLDYDGTNWSKTSVQALLTASDLNLTLAQQEQGLSNLLDVASASGKYGYKVLKASATFASQVLATNTIYEIKDKFTLTSNVNIPAGCVLKFNGGSLDGGTITGNNTRIIGVPNINSTKAGTWFDIGTTANRPILTPNQAGTVYFDTTLNKNVTWDGNRWIEEYEYSEVTNPLDDNYINSSGELIVSSVVSGTGTKDDPFVYKFGTTPFIEIGELEGIYYKGKLDNNFVGVAAYDKDYKLVTGWKLISGSAADQTKDVHILAENIPAGTKFIRFSSNKSYAYEFRIESYSAVERNYREVTRLRTDVDNLKLFSKGITGFWDTGHLNPTMESFLGDKKILNDWDFYLIHEDGDNTTIVGKLQKNNLFRMEDGSFAPVMVRTQEDESVNPGYETTDYTYSILRAWNGDKYLLNGIGSDGRTLFGLYNVPTEVDGVTAKLMEFTGICADLPTMYQSKLRCIAFKNGIDTGCGSKGKSNLFTLFEHGAYPKTNVSQITNNTNARSKNTDANSVNIFSEQMGFHKYSHIYAAFMKYGTYDLHSPNLFGSGISSNEAVSAALWGTVTGIKWSIDGGTTWNYQKFGDTPAGVYLDANGTAATSWSETMNNYYAKLQTLEAQMALSYVVENNINPDTEFTFNGGTYYYKTINGTVSPLEGEMNAKLFKKIAFSQSAFNAGGDAITVEGEVILQVAVVDGYISWGDVYDYGQAGFEIVATHDNDNAVTRDAYLCTKQHELYLGDATLGESPFDFQSTYEHVGTSKNHTFSAEYMATVLPFSFLGDKNGGTLHTGACAYNYKSNSYSGTKNHVYRLGVRSRGIATNSSCSARYWHGYDLASDTYRYYASAYQARLKDL